MSRITVIPENLRSVSAQIKQTARDLQKLAGQIQGAGQRLDWEVRQSSQVDEKMNHAAKLAQSLAAQADEMGNSLAHKAEAFNTADRQGMTDIGNLPAVPRHLPVFPPIRLPGFPGKLPLLPIIALPIVGLPWPPHMVILPILPKLPNFIKDWFDKPQTSQPGSTTPAVGTGQKPAVQTQPDIVQPGSPWEKYYVSGGGFPSYGDDGTLHNGVDIKPTGYDPKQTYPVKPIGPGKIYQVGQQLKKDQAGNPVMDPQGNPELAGYGNYIIVEHELEDGSKVYSRYAHLAGLPGLKKGDPVLPDHEIGVMGSTGKSTGPHVHLEIFRTEKPTQGFWGHKPSDLVDPKKPESGTWEQRLRQDYVDPIQVLDGKSGWKFRISK